MNWKMTLLLGLSLGWGLAVNAQEPATPEAKQEEPKKEEPKKEEPKKEEPKKEEPKKEEPKKEEPKPDPNAPKYQPNDIRRPRPTVVVPPTTSTPEQTGKAPSDAIVLFDGTSLAAWQGERKPKEGETDEPQWKVENGYFEIKPGSGGIRTRERFGSCQIHFEWRTPDVVKGNGQGRGNSGIYIQGHPEVQLLDSYHNDTYPDGQAAGIYGHFPPLVNASLPPGEWQTYDIIYAAPKFDEKKKLVKKPLYTVLHNGVLVHHAVEVSGNAVECHFSLQDHGNPLRFRNFWVRRLRDYDEHPPSVELGGK